MCFLVTMCLLAARAFCADIEYGRDIRPFLSDTCFTCHGPDQEQRVSDLRLDTEEGLFAEVEGGRSIVPGDPNASVLLQRVASNDPDLRMPPPDSGLELSPERIEMLRQWIEDGAQWKHHWAFVAPRRPLLPSVSDPKWCENPIDRFILAGIERTGLQVSSPASRETLIRRVTLDMTGLPPTLAEIDAFLVDQSADAWPRVIDRLLQSPRYGERVASDWLDAARYADTSGYQNDGPREMWRWRDWVIDAFNANMPYDQFTIEQIAGDLLPNPSLTQRIATGFNRNHRGNAEGGIVPEEFQVEYVVDRVDTTCTVWLGLTMGCARCHDHKYDPFTQKDFYRLFAYFNNIPENGRALKEGNSPPYIQAPTAEMQLEMDRIDQRVHIAELRVAELAGELVRQQSEWENVGLPGTATDDVDNSGSSVGWTITDGLLHRFRMDGSLNDGGTKAVELAAGPARSFLPGKHNLALSFDGDGAVEAGDFADFGYFDKFTIALWAKSAESTGTLLSRMTPVEQGSGYYVHLEDGKLQINLVKRWLDDSLRVTSRQELELDRWQHLVVSYDGSRRASGIRVYLNGIPLEMDVDYDGLNQSFSASEPVRFGGGHADFSGHLDDIQIYDRVLSAEEAAVVAVAESIRETLGIDAVKRSSAHANKLTSYFISRGASDNIRTAHRQLTQARRDRQQFDEDIPTVMIMQEMETRRPTFVLQRGQYDAPGAQVLAGTPSGLPAHASSRNDRLDLARWLVSHDNPLTARVTVNRIWQMYFGSGLVKTVEDFGSQGDLPSHPLLLDYLATEFMRNGWDLKAMHRMIATSASYQQSSLGSPDSVRLDPKNRLLARGPRLRLTAETVRDQALAVSGLLSERTGGPSVRPYQPEGLWKEIASTTHYKQSQGADLYRRSLYTYWKRTVAPPTMVTLDATSRESCIVKRSRTNTPLQALALMNETSFVECARVFSERILTMEGTDETRLSTAFRTVTGRLLSNEEREILLSGLRRYMNDFSASPNAANELVSVGDSPVDKSIDRVELAAWTTTVSVILNLDEVVNKE